MGRMNEPLERALAQANALLKTINEIYDNHDHEYDIIGGTLISSLRLLANSVVESIVTAAFYINSQKKVK